MKFLVIIFLSVFLVSSSGRAQDSTKALDSTQRQDTTKVSESSRFERAGYVLGASLGLSLFDYLGFNIARNNWDTHYGHPALLVYHLVLGAVGTAINYILYEKLGLSSAIAFDLMWWTWADDFGFYGWANLLNPAEPWGNRSNTYFSDNTCCASWTPVGLVRKNNEFIPTNTLVAQALVGFSISMAIALW
jgi:hypothetical protein